MQFSNTLIIEHDINELSFETGGGHFITRKSSAYLIENNMAILPVAIKNLNILWNPTVCIVYKVYHLSLIVL